MAIGLALAGMAAAATPAVKLSGGSAAQKALMRRILAGMSPSLITSVALTPPPRNLGDWPRAPTYLAVNAGGGPRDEGEWETWIFKGAFGDLSPKLHLPPMFRFTPISSPPAATAAGAAALQSSVPQSVSSTAGTSGVQVVSFRVMQPDGLAFVLVLRVGDPASYMTTDLPALLQQIVGNGSTGPQLDGSYIALEDSTGTVVWAGLQQPADG